ncbi:DUF6082 family protein [Streptomyces verrucosisporus]|uniref:DUF6082 family protein n=1 Tax=Streptomyces verrucosisporus TaxID=1695161 RepID=UPI001F125276|nr:DUF6082 family protein [Streptomyces verrucosisporus]
MALRAGLLWVALGFATLLSIIGAPFLLRWVAPEGMNWAELSNISQAYAAISVPFTAAALLGAIVSTIYQARQARVSQEEARSANHRDLLAIALEDVNLNACWGPKSMSLTRQQWKQHTYINMILSFWYSNYTGTGAALDAITKDNATRLFRGQVGREFWALYSAEWQVFHSGGRRERKFIRVLDQAYAEAVAAGPAVPFSEFFVPEDSE